MQTIIKTTKQQELEITGITLLSTEEAKTLPKDILKADKEWWLRSPSHPDGIYASTVFETGFIFSGGQTVSTPLGVRPALKIETSNLSLFDKFEWGDFTWTVISDKLALCDIVFKDYKPFCNKSIDDLVDFDEYKQNVDYHESKIDISGKENDYDKSFIKKIY